MEYARIEHILIFICTAVTVWFLVIYFLPAMVLSVFRRAILVTGFGDGPIPVNTLYMQPRTVFTNPFEASGSKISVTGVNRDTLITVGWLDLKKEALLLHIPDMCGRYYSLQFTDPSKNIVFTYLGTRTTGTDAGDFLISGPNWNGCVPSGMGHVALPRNSFLLIGRILVRDDKDLTSAYDLAKQIQLAPYIQ